ncbi:MAG: hypothetical protein ABI761_06420 [Saprospiraceae bacterium]
MKYYLVLSVLLLNIYCEAQEKLQYHIIQKDQNGFIIPWNNKDVSIAYDQVIQKVWHFWDSMRTDMNGLPYYMNHQVWRPDRNDPRGLGGDQFAMALESWRLLYAYTGNERIKENMRFMVDYYLSHGLSRPDDQWPYLPYPYNTLIYSGIYDGDMILGKGFLQPDKAGSFGIELLRLYKMTAGEIYPNITSETYLQSAIQIANTLATHAKTGDANHSPLPFKVNARISSIGALYERKPDGSADTILSNYTSNWSGTLELWMELTSMKLGDTVLYKTAFNKVFDWMMTYPVKNNRWGPFFEDVPGWSDTQINAITFAQFMMNHRDLLPDWNNQVKNIFDWVYTNLANKKWDVYGVSPINEQTAYRVPGNSHTSRQAAAQLQYSSLTSDPSWTDASIRQLSWATYMVDDDGKNKYFQDENWLTDGYGDYIRHYLKAMAFHPALAPNETHLLYSTSVIQHVFYKDQVGKYYFPPLKETKGLIINYSSFDLQGEEWIRLKEKPVKVLFDGKQTDMNSSVLEWSVLSSGGILKIKRSNVKNVSLYGNN